jgi:hypothetical protein
MLQVLVKHALAGAFDSDEVKVLSHAFDQAWQAVEKRRDLFYVYKNAAREVLALRIISRSHSWANATLIAFAMMPLLYLARTNLKSLRHVAGRPAFQAPRSLFSGAVSPALPSSR